MEVQYHSRLVHVQELANRAPAIRRVFIAPDRVISTKEHYTGLASAVAEVMLKHDLSRRRFPDWMTDTVCGFEGEIRYLDGRPYSVPENWVDGLFNNEGSFRWLGSFIRAAKVPPKQSPQRRVWPRLRAIRLCICIAEPDLIKRLPK